MRVLSIDFDYFQKVDLKTLAYYPDGHDLGTGISKLIWASHYASPIDSEHLLKVDIDMDKIYRIKRIIEDSYGPNVKILICNSHKNIYQFIKDSYDGDSEYYEGVDIYNVDMHHDLFNNSPTLDCGNWVSHILKDIPGSSITWIANPISKEAYGMDNDKFNMVSEDLEDLEGIEFDAIFLCRSDIWSPPHLDSYFLDLADFIIGTFDDVRGEKQVLEIRDCMPEIAQIKQSMSDFEKEMNMGRES